MKSKYSSLIFLIIVFLTTTLNAEITKEEILDTSKQSIFEKNQLTDEQRAERLSRFYFPALYVGVRDTIQNKSNDQLNEFIVNVPLYALQGFPKINKDYYILGMFYFDYDELIKNKIADKEYIIHTYSFLKTWIVDESDSFYRITPYIVPIRALSVQHKERYSYMLPGIDLYLNYSFITLRSFAELFSYRNLSNYRTKGAILFNIYRTDIIASVGIDRISWKDTKYKSDGNLTYKYIKLISRPTKAEGGIFIALSYGYEDLKNNSGNSYDGQLNYNYSKEKMILFEAGLGASFF